MAALRSIHALGTVPPRAAVVDGERPDDNQHLYLDDQLYVDLTFHVVIDANNNVCLNLNDLHIF